MGWSPATTARMAWRHAHGRSAVLARLPRKYAQTRDDKFWAIQAKFRAEMASALTRRDVDSLAGLAQGRPLARLLVVHTCARPIRKLALYRLPFSEIGLERWVQTTPEDWDRMRQRLTQEPERPRPRRPDDRPYQLKAIEAAKKHFVNGGQARGRLIMPCGTGKSLVALWIAQTLRARTIIVAVPSLRYSSRRSKTGPGKLWPRMNSRSQTGSVCAAMRPPAARSGTSPCEMSTRSAFPRPRWCVKSPNS